MYIRSLITIIALGLSLLPASSQAQFIFSEPVTFEEVATEPAYILVEADTYTPDFYNGRAEPSIGSAIQLHIITPTIQNSQNLQYHWKVNDLFLTNEPQAGLTTASTIAPFGTSITVRVLGYDTSGKKVVDKSERIRLSEPTLHFYEINPLRGSARRVVPNNFILSGTEATFRAEPFFFTTDVLNDEQTVAWYLNKQEIQNASRDPLSITLESAGERGSAYVDVELRDYLTFAHKLVGGFKVQY